MMVGISKSVLIGVVVTIVISLLATRFFNNPANLSSLADLMTSRNAHAETNSKVVIVVGGGLAGLSAALEAQKHGARVYVVEKEVRLGGNSAKASSGMNAVGTPAQHAAHSQDTPAIFLEDTLSSGGGACVHELADTIVAHSAEAVAFLAAHGVDLSVLSKCGGHRHARTHRAKPPPAGQPARNIGFEITSKLIELLNQTANINVLTDSRVKQLIQEKGVVVGVKYEDKSHTLHELRGDAVIITTGGYAADRSSGGLLEKYGGTSLAGLPTTNGPWATGDGVRLVEGVGAKFVLMDQIQIHPTGFVDPKDALNPTKFLAPEALRAVGGILINKEGKRFVDELSLRNQVTTSIFEHGFRIGEGDKHLVAAYLVLNDEAVNAFGPAALKFYMSKGFIVQYPNADEFAATAGVDKDSLHQTLSAYNQAKEKGSDEFGKTTFPVAFEVEKPLSVITITPSIHYTMGGALITTDAQVVGTNGAVIPGLYAAGEASGGVHGNNRLAGNSLLECVVFGRIAGTNAARSV